MCPRRNIVDDYGWNMAGAKKRTPCELCLAPSALPCCRLAERQMTLEELKLPPRTILVISVLPSDSVDSAAVLPAGSTASRFSYAQ